MNVFASQGPYPFAVSVFTFTGKGSLFLAAFSAGSLFTRFQYSGQQDVSIDVLSVVIQAMGAGQPIVGFNLRTAPSTIGVNGPFVAFDSLEYPPTASLMLGATEPATVVLSLAGLAVMACLWKKTAINRENGGHPGEAKDLLRDSPSRRWDEAAARSPTRRWIRPGDGKIYRETFACQLSGPQMTKVFALDVRLGRNSWPTITTSRSGLRSLS